MRTHRSGGECEMQQLRRLRSGILSVIALLTLATHLLGQVPITYQHIYDSLNQLARVIDSAGNVITYTYDEAGNLLAETRTTVGNLPRPTITNASPNQVNQGDPAT